MENWHINADKTVSLQFDEGTVIVKKEDFDRAFGTMINSTKDEVEKDYGINK